MNPHQRRIAPRSVFYKTSPALVGHNRGMKPNIVPMLQYDDAATQIAFLVHAFGFTRQRADTTPAGAVDRAELRFGAGVVAVSSASAATGIWRGVRQGIHVADVGGTPRTARDPGDYLWSFGPDDMGAGEGEVTLVPELRYQDIVSASAWLKEHFGFDTTFQVPGPAGAPVHAEMRLGKGTIFVSPMSTEGSYADVRQFANLIVDDPDRHHAHAAAAGANVVITPRDTPFGARFYAVRDPENLLWWISTYRPATPSSARVHS
jgi:uncharacterized glyoxalase superfamily protein PhnB